MSSQYSCLTAFAGRMTVDNSNSEERKYDPYNTNTVRDFLNVYYDNLNEVTDFDYNDTLERYGYVDVSVERLNIEAADLQLLLAIITYCVRRDRFCEGSLTECALSGLLDRCLYRLKELDK